MPILEQEMTPASRWQMTQRSVHTAQPGRPDWIEALDACVGSGAGGATGASAATAATTTMAAAKLAIVRSDARSIGA